MRRVLFAVLLILSAIDSKARDGYIPTINRPLSMVLHKDFLLRASPNIGSRRIPAHSILKYRFSEKTTDTITDPAIPEAAECLGENTRYLFTGGWDGLGVLDKKTGRWSRWYQEPIRTLVVGERNLWLGTTNGVLEVDLATRRTRRFAIVTIPNRNRVYSLAKTDGFLFVGTYKQDIGKGNGDMIGTGLHKVELSTGAISSIPFPAESGREIVLDIYPVPGNPDGLRLVAGCWTVVTLDYFLKTGRIVKRGSEKHHLESVLAKNGRAGDSAFAGPFLDSFLSAGLHNWPSYGLPNPVAFEIVHMLFARKDFRTVERLLGDKDFHVRSMVCSALRHEDSPRANAYLIRAILDPEPEVVRSAASILRERKAKEAIPNLRKAMETKNEEILYSVLHALILSDSGAAREIIRSGDPAQIGRLATIVRIGNHRGIIEAIAQDGGESKETRRMSKAMLDKMEN